MNQPHAPELAAHLARLFQRPDPHYTTLHTSDLPKKWSWARRWRRMRAMHDLARATDHRSQEQRDQDQLGPFYEFVIAARAEDRNVARVRKAQAALRHRHAT